MASQPVVDPQGFVMRLERLENQNRRLRLAVAGLFVLLAWVMVAAFRPAGAEQAAGARTVVANEFLLKDPQGRTRARLGFTTRGAPGLDLYDANGTLRAAVVDLFPDAQPAVYLWDANGALRAGLDGSPMLALYDARRAVRADLALGDAGSPVLDLYDANRALRAYLILGADGSPELNLTDPAGYRSVLGVTDLAAPATGKTHKTSGASLVMFDKKGNVIWQAPQP